jgi:hypothetical protein
MSISKIACPHGLGEIVLLHEREDGIYAKCPLVEQAYNIPFGNIGT